MCCPCIGGAVFGRGRSAAPTRHQMTPLSPYPLSAAPPSQGDGLGVLMREGARRGMWPQAFAESRTFAGDPVIVDPDVTEGERRGRGAV